MEGFIPKGRELLIVWAPTADDRAVLHRWAVHHKLVDRNIKSTFFKQVYGWKCILCNKTYRDDQVFHGLDWDPVHFNQLQVIYVKCPCCKTVSYELSPVKLYNAVVMAKTTELLEEIPQGKLSDLDAILFNKNF